MRKFEDGRTALTKEAIKNAFLDELFYMQGKFPALATKNDYYMALAYAVRDRMLQRWISTAAAYTKHALPHRRVPVGRVPDGSAPRQQPHQSRHPRAASSSAWPSSDSSFEELLQQEEEPGLGNGGLGRLAACFIDSLATLEVPALGYGIRYEFGIFHQEIVDGWQVEKTDKWLRFGNPWELVRPEWAVERQVRRHHRAATSTSTSGCACAGCRTRSSTACPTTRRFSAIAPTPPTPCACGAPRRPNPSISPIFNSGDYYGAVNQKVTSENLSKVLYPNDEQVRGKELRLEQQYFFVSCSLQDMFRILRGAEACRVEQLPREIRGAAQRHASGDRDRRADAPADR